MSAAKCDFRAEGNAAYGRGDYLGAAAAFTRSLARGDGPRAPVLDARSGVQVAVGRWRDAAWDAGRALAAPDCPPERHLRLQLRLANCLRRLRQRQQADLEFQKAQRMIQRSVF